MRMWDVEDNKAIPSDLVREQDFILKVRRMQRLGTPFFVTNLILTATQAEEIGSKEEAHQRLEAFAKESRADYAEMSNGDVFLTWTTSEKLPFPVLETSAATVALAEGKRNELTRVKERLVKSYSLPGDYVALRERANIYVEMSRLAAIPSDTNTPAQLLQSMAAQGPLTTWTVHQIENLLDNVDLRKFTQNQTAYERKRSGNWEPLFEECSVNTNELKKAHFPKIDLTAQENLFRELCLALDQHLLTALTRDLTPIAGKTVRFNLSVRTIMGSTFARFAHEVPRYQHEKIGFEFHRSDLFQNFAMTLNAIETLHHEGFKVTIDDITLDTLPYINLARFDVEHIKINVARVYAAQLDNAGIRATIKTLPLEKLVFAHCDTEQALATGLELGVTKYQGWYLDDKFKKD